MVHTYFTHLGTRTTANEKRYHTDTHTHNPLLVGFIPSNENTHQHFHTHTHTTHIHELLHITRKTETGTLKSDISCVV